MSSVEPLAEPVRVSVSNVGGIDQTTVEFSPGITILAGRNATNRTSLLQAIMAALGSENVSLKGDAAEGQVSLELGEDTYTRTLDRDGDRIRTGGDPYLDDPELADLFAFLLESNEARRAVARSEDLRELIMRPIDTDAIQADIQRLEAEKRSIDERLDELERRQRRLPDLEQQRTDLQDRIEQKETELADLEAEIEAFDADVDDTRDDQAQLDEKFQQLRDARTDLEDVRFTIDTKTDSLDALENRRDDLEAEREEMPDSPMGEVQSLDEEIDRLRSQLQDVNATISELQTVVQFNEEMLDGTDGDVAAALRGDETSTNTSASDPVAADNGSVTDRLVDDSQVVCWTCGSEVDRDQIEATLDRLRELRQEKVARRNDLQDEIDDVEDEKIVYEEKQRQRDQVERELQQVDSEIDQRQSRIAELRERREELEAEVEDLEDTVEALESEEYSEILDKHKQANQLEFEIGRLEDQLADVEEEITDIDADIEGREDLKARREELSEELEERRTRIDRIEAEAVEEFNEHMETILELLGYANLDRIWIERTEQEVREGRRKVEKRSFDLHVVRSTDSGATYEDTIDHLSESEREVTGLIFGLAGYLVHEVYETVPFMLLDSLEAIDSERIATLVEYFGEYADSLVVALLPEDASALSAEYQRVADI